MAFENDYPQLDYLLGEVFEAAGDIKLALADGRVSIDEVIGAIPDDAVGAYLRRLLEALGGLPGEVAKVTKAGPWGMIAFVQAVAAKVMGGLFK